MYPHERSLVERMKDKPFALIGVNSDSKERVRAAIEENNITWRSFWDGGSPGGPIATAWGVHGWPTIYVIDDRGVIRYTNVRGHAMDQAVDELIEKMAEGADLVTAKAATTSLAELESPKSREEPDGPTREQP
jgi:peroxiredoxin